MRRMQACALALLLTIAVIGCDLPGGSPTPAPIIIVASPTPAPTQAINVPPTSASEPTVLDAPTASPVATALDVPAASPAATVAASAPEPSIAPAATSSVAAPEMPQIQLSQATLIAIFRGEISDWSDPRIQADNPGISFPKLPIRVVHRSDPSGTTRAITEYFVQVNPWWSEHIGAAYRLGDAGSAPWPTGTGTNGSSQLAKAVKAMPGAIGYVAPSYALNEQLPLAILQNSAGNWVAPASSTLGEAAANTTNKLDRQLRGFIVNAPGQNAYPLAIYTWIIACPTSLSVTEAQSLTDFLYWSISDPQAIVAARQLGYEPLPPAVRQQAIAQLEAIRIDTQQMFTAPAAGQRFTPRAPAAPVTLSGSGATFPSPLYQQLIERYQQVQPGVTFSYAATGSTQGRADLLQAGVVQFAGSDEAVADNDTQITRAACQPAPLHVPMMVGAVGIVYHLPPQP